MSGFNDLVAAAHPYLCTETIAATAGMSWEWSYELRDDAADLVDFTGCTGTAIISRAGVTLLTCTVDLTAVGFVKVTATPSGTLPLVAPGGAHISAQHEIELTNAAGRKCMLVGAGGGRFTIRAQVG